MGILENLLDKIKNTCNQDQDAVQRVAAAADDDPGGAQGEQGVTGGRQAGQYGRDVREGQRHQSQSDQNQK